MTYWVLMRALHLTAFTLLLLAGCSDEPENIQAKAEETMDELENRAAEISAEASNNTDQAVQALDNQTAILVNQAELLANQTNEAAANAQ